MIAITYRLRLVQPVIITMLDSGDENAARSLNYIPGSVIRGALAMRYIAQRGLANEDAATDERCRQLFFDEAVRFLNCTPADENSERTLPIPLSWYASKSELLEWRNDSQDKSLGVLDGAVNADVFGQVDDLKPVASEAAFCQLTHDDDRTAAKLYSPNRETSTHISRPHKRRDINAKTERQVFTYESLAADQLLCGVILAQTTDLAQEVKDLLTQHPDLMIGRSRSAGYGHVVIEAISDPILDWHEVPDQTVAVSPLEREVTLKDGSETVQPYYTVTLLSDAVLRNEYGQFCADPRRWLGLTKDTAIESSVQMVALGGFNRKWQLPTPQVLAVRAGSVFAFPANQANQAALQAAREKGIGERRNDGLGRIAINWQRCEEISVEQGNIANVTNRTSLSASPSEQDQTAAVTALILEGVWRNHLESALVQRSNKIIINRPPSNAMLSRIMLVARQAAFAQDLRPLAQFMAAVRGYDATTLPKPSDDLAAWVALLQQSPAKIGQSRKPAQRALEAAFIGSTSLGEWIVNRIVKHDLEAVLQLTDPQKPKPKLGKYEATLTPTLAAEFTARLIEQVVKQAMKQNKKERGAA